MRLPPVVKVPLIRGDNATIQASLVRDGAPYSPPNGSIIIFTAKRNPSDPDATALFQKFIGLNLSVADNVATMVIYPDDTLLAESDRDGYTADVQVEEPDGTVTTAWLGRLLFTSDVTREYTTSVPVYTVNPPLPGDGGPITMPLYTFTQAVPSALWIVNHNLGAVIATTVFDTAGNEVEAEVINPTLNQTRILFSTPTAGKARCL